VKDTEDHKTNNKPQFVRLKETIRITNFSRSSIYRGIRDGSFPVPVRIGERAIAFKLS
jgi:prophage regulatory protein